MMRTSPGLRRPTQSRGRMRSSVPEALRGARGRRWNDSARVWIPLAGRAFLCYHQDVASQKRRGVAEGCGLAWPEARRWRSAGGRWR